MKNNSLLIKAWALAVSSVVMVSCEVMDDYMHVDSSVIKFGVDADADGAPSTRATQYADSPVVMLGEGGSDTLYLHASIDVNTATVSKEAKAGTRGVPINSGNFQAECKNFGVTAYTQGDGKLFMSDEEVSNYANGAWSPSGGARYWPEDETLDFYAYAPYLFKNNKQFDNGALTINRADHTMSFSYTVPTNNGEDAVAQPDIMFAYAACSRSTTNERGNVPLEFAHALAAVKFVANDIAGCTINRITLKGLYGAGECTFTPAGKDGKGEDKPSGTFAWNNLGDKKDFTQKFDVKLNDQQSGEQPITGEDSPTTFMMIPQQLADATVVVELTTNDGVTQAVEGKLASGNLTEWKAGNIYTYKISTESINWTYVFEVTPTISFDLGVTSGKYQVKSYRYRTQDESVKEAVPWEVTGVTATDKPIESAGKPLDDPKSYAPTFTWEGKGTNNGQWQDYDIGVAKTVMHTTCSADETLKKTPTKGSPESPCDLSTEGGGGRTTANCYVVNAAGTYKLPLVYGNAIVNGKTNSQAYSDSHFVDYNNRPITDPWIKKSSGTPKDATLVWSDGFYMFTDVHLEGDYLVFTINKEYLQQANAIVAVRDDKGIIMWSWHIWVTERDINQTHKVDDWSNGATYDMMSSNLGWVDGKQVYYDLRELKFTFTQTKTNDVKIMTVTQEGATFDYKDAGSTYYQWGRKDPIVALMNRDKTGVNDYRRLDVPTNDYLYKTQPGWVTSAEGIKHPNVYYVQNANFSSTAWLTDAAYSPKLWNIDGTEKNVWVANSRKTVYDPSPKGFKVPVPRAFSVFVDGGATSENICGTLNGYIEPAPNNYQYHVYTKNNDNGDPIPFTATGQRSNRGDLGSGPGSLWAMYGVYYWTNAAQSNGTSYSFVIRREDEVNQDGSTSKIASYTIGFLGTQTMARPVRPFKE